MISKNQGNKYRMLFLGIIVFSAGIAMSLIANIFLTTMSLCKYPNVDAFPPGATITMTCPVVADVGQDLTFRIAFSGQGSARPITLPAHVEIRDPSGSLLRNEDFISEKIILYVKPELHGNYAATVTILENRDNRIATGEPRIHYAFGYLSNLTYGDVYNPLGSAIGSTVVVGNLVYLAGAGIMIYGGIKARRRK